MAQQSKIEKFGCEVIVANGLRADKSLRAIAEECSDWAGVKISHTAVQRYIEQLNQNKKQLVTADDRSLVNVVHQDFDIIQNSLKLAHALLRRFEYVDNLPEYFEERMQELEHQLVSEGINAEYLNTWAQMVNAELRRKVLEITSLSKESREIMKFMVDLKERVFRFELMSEYLNLFMTIFQRYSPDAYEKAMQEVGSNPRMAQIVEQQRSINSGKEDY
ncbi:hypothetical protein [Tumebacillus flagellatus]|uniref:Uncharacterized protein n=1 Tax=Tumebacillus flagellatus TaxID=1157490 RepID=A0A074LLS3_9BACL|nr:hypothetical protein [Tumebacillus flagellatus]KEO81505.1 hypothetical protein EL26_20755 [Tumebacillus flagellatus]